MDKHSPNEMTNSHMLVRQVRIVAMSFCEPRS